LIDDLLNNFQLVLNEDLYRKYAGYLSVPVRVSGKIFTGNNIHHKTKQLIDVSAITIIPSKNKNYELAGNEILCRNKYMLKQFDKAFAACNAASQEAPTYLNQLNIGNIYLHGFGVSKNMPLALQYFQKASSYQGGDGTAEHNLGYAYSEGIGVMKDNRIALDFYLKAAYSGHEGSQYNLAISYFNGDGLEINYVDGYAWLMISSQSGSKDASNLLSQVNHQFDDITKTKGKKNAAKLLKVLPKSRLARNNDIKQQLMRAINSESYQLAE
jgi:hypothetical protein